MRKSAKPIRKESKEISKGMSKDKFKEKTKDNLNKKLNKKLKRKLKEEQNLTKSASKTLKKSNKLQILNSVKPDNIEALKTDYMNKGLDKIPDTFVLYRIIGNDLFPRHKKGQSCENLQFVLKNEPELENCEKIWIVNRIIDKEEEYAIIQLLRLHSQSFIHLPFHQEEYKLIGWDTECLPNTGYFASEEFDILEPAKRDRLIAATYRLKNNYVMNNNGARNIALRDGKSRAKWVLPWDGNCFVTSAAWKQILADVTASPYLKYFAIPMTRVVENEQLLTNEFTPSPVSEPQLIFRTDSIAEFNEAFCYGRRPKVELLWHLGVPGRWDRWKDDPWDQIRRPQSGEAHQFGVAGWTARMSSGIKELDREAGDKGSLKKRGSARLEAIISTLRNLDMIAYRNYADSNKLLFFRTEVLIEERNRCHSGQHLPPIHQLIIDAEEALTRGPYSVIDKKTLPPSGKANDYWHPAPYWWPDPNTKNGLPYIQRDGERVPGTRMYEPESDKYDRTRLQYVFDDSITLALAWYFTGEKKYADYGARIFERFFVNPATQMTPHLDYAQVRMGRNNNKGCSTGIIEMKDMYYYLDAIRLLQSAGVITENALSKFKEWLFNYLDWLIYSKQGEQERRAMNNHGTYYDLQVAVIADFLDEYSLLFETIIRAQSRIAQQFTSDGSQPEEMKRTLTAHYCCFNLQGWISLAEMVSKWGANFWSFKTSHGVSLMKGAQWLLSYIGKDWPYEQIDEFDTDRYLPILFSIPQELIDFPLTSKLPKAKYEVKPRFHPHDGVRPYWNLGLSSKSL